MTEKLTSAAAAALLDRAASARAEAAQALQEARLHLDRATEQLQWALAEVERAQLRSDRAAEFDDAIATLERTARARTAAPR